MKTEQAEKRVGRAFLVFSLLFGIGIVLLTTAQAQNQDDRYAQDRDGDGYQCHSIYQKATKAIVPVSATAKCSGVTSARHTSTVMPMATPATSPHHHRDSDKANTKHNATNQAHQERRT